MAYLAIKGGDAVRTKPFPRHHFIGEEEKKAVNQVLDSGVLSEFLGCWHEGYFYGGPVVQEFERNWAAYVDTKHAVSVNSNTSGLVCAIGAAGVGPGDEVIVTPWSMCATATSIVAWGGIPVFADIEGETYGLDPAAVGEKITPNTKAIMVTDIFGHPADIDPLMDLAKKHGLYLIEDAAQAAGAVYKGNKVGGLSHMTVFSLNCHKHIHTGEGGVVTTNDDKLAERLQLIRNHGEAVVKDKGVTEITNAFGFNLRYTEVHAAIGIEQLKKLPHLLDLRIANADYLAKELSKFKGISSCTVKEDCRHVYYIQPFVYDESITGIPVNRLIDAVAAELPTSPDLKGVPLLWSGFGDPIYTLPMYQERKAFADGSPFKQAKNKLNYNRGLCPVCERLNEKSMFFNDFIKPPATEADMQDVFSAFEKVYEHLDEIR